VENWQQMISVGTSLRRRSKIAIAGRRLAAEKAAAQLQGDAIEKIARDTSSITNSECFVGGLRI
jgi:hypothetical protein